MKNITYILVVIILAFGILSLFSIAENSMGLSQDTSTVSKDTSTKPQDSQDTSTVSKDTSTTSQDSQDTQAKSEFQVNKTINIARNIGVVKALLSNKTDINTSVYFNSTTKEWNVEFYNENKTINISVVINDFDKRILKFRSYPPVSWAKIRNRNRELIDAMSSQPAIRNFMKLHANASLTINYDKIMNQWHAALLSKNRTEKLMIVIDNDTKEIIHAKILSTPEHVISKRELEALVNNSPAIKKFIIDCRRNNDCGEIKIKRWYNEEKGVWIVTVYGSCKNCKKTVFIDGKTGSVVENKKLVDKTRLLNLIRSREIIKNFIRNHPNAKINTVYDEISNQWYVTISYRIGGPGKVKEITVIVDRETGVIASVNEWEYSRDKFK